jgi:hypothetical protein
MLRVKQFRNVEGRKADTREKKFWEELIAYFT